MTVPFTTGSESSYLFNDAAFSSTAGVALSGGKAQLKATGQSDDSDDAFADATLSGTQWRSGGAYQYVTLNATTNRSEMEAGWTPHWDDLVFYWNMNGSGAVPASGITVQKGGPCEQVSNRSTYETGKLDGGVKVFNDSYLRCDATTVGPIANHLSIGGWLKHSGGTSIAYAGAYSTYDTNFRLMIQRTNLASTMYMRIDTNLTTNLNCSVGGVLDGKWHHILFTLSNGTAKAYRDGALVNTCAYTQGTGFGSSVAKFTLARGMTNDAGTYFDEWAIWKGDGTTFLVLSDAEVQTIYSRQAPTFSGQVTSKIMDAYAAQSWTSLATSTTLPFGKELPSASASETATAYPAIIGNLTTGLKGYWKFNETALGTVNPGAKDFFDSSGNGFHGTHSNSPTLSWYAPMGSSIRLNGSNQRVSVGIPMPTAETEFTVMARVLPYVLNTGGSDVRSPIISSWNTNSAGNQKGFNLSIYYDSVAATHYFVFDLADGVNVCTAKSAATAAGTFAEQFGNRWLDVVGVFKANTFLRIYVNGTLVSTSTTCVPAQLSSNVTTYIGYSGVNSAYFYGYIDEVALWNRALSVGTSVADNEILQLYRRRANRIRYQIRTCDTSTCANENLATNNGQGWVGPDNTFLTYFSERSNNQTLSASGIGTGDVKLTAPDFLFSAFSSLSVPVKQWFQYRAILESDEEDSQCNYGAAANCSPELRSVTVSPEHYPAGRTITSKAAIGVSFLTLDEGGFTTPNPVGTCAGVARHTLSRDGTLFYYWDTGTSRWSLSSNSYATASAPADISAHLSTFPTDVGTGTLQIKTFLVSTGVAPCEVGALQVTGTR